MNIIELVREAGIPVETDWAGRPSTLVLKDGSTYLRGIDDLECFATLVRNATLEKCAVVAWNHYMARCKLNGISPTVFEGWCSAAAIRALKGQP